MDTVETNSEGESSNVSVLYSDRPQRILKLVHTGRVAPQEGIISGGSGLGCEHVFLGTAFISLYNGRLLSKTETITLWIQIQLDCGCN